MTMEFNTEPHLIDYDDLRISENPKKKNTKPHRSAVSKRCSCRRDTGSIR